MSESELWFVISWGSMFGLIILLIIGLTWDIIDEWRWQNRGSNQADRDQAGG